MGQVNVIENRSKISISAESREKPTSCLTDFQKVVKLRCL